MRYGRDTSLAIFHVPHRGFYATQQVRTHSLLSLDRTDDWCFHLDMSPQARCYPGTRHHWRRPFREPLRLLSVSRFLLLPDDLVSRYTLSRLHKRNYNLSTGDCLNDADYKILAFSAREVDGDISVLLPPAEDLDELIGSSKWMVRKATAAVFGKNLATSLEIVGPDSSPLGGLSSLETGGCQTGGGKLEW